MGVYNDAVNEALGRLERCADSEARHQEAASIVNWFRETFDPEEEKQEHLAQGPSEAEDQMSYNPNPQYPASQEEQDKLIEQFSRKQASISDIKNLFLARAMQSAPGVASASLNISNDALRNMGYMAAGAAIPIAADLAWTEAKRRAAKALQPELYNQPGVGGSGWPKYQ